MDNLLRAPSHSSIIRCCPKTSFFIAQMSVANPFEQTGMIYILLILPTVVQATALFRALSPGQPSLVSFRIMENGLIGYEATKGELPDAQGTAERETRPLRDNRFAIISALVGRYSLTFGSSS